MKRFRVPMIGCLALILLALAPIPVAVVAHRIEHEQAKSRWAEKGGPDYSLVVEQICFCAMVGQFKITVRSGHVTGVEVITDYGSPLGMGKASEADLIVFDRMTVEEMLKTAGSSQADQWTSPWFNKISIEYDPDYGYVTRYYSDMNGEVDNRTGNRVTDSGYSYNARDLVLEEP